MRTTRALLAAPLAFVAVVLLFFVVIAMLLADAISGEQWAKELLPW